MGQRSTYSRIGERTQPTSASGTLALEIEPTQRIRKHELRELVECAQTTELRGAHLRAIEFGEFLLLFRGRRRVDAIVSASWRLTWAISEIGRNDDSESRIKSGSIVGAR